MTEESVAVELQAMQKDQLAGPPARWQIQLLRQGSPAEDHTESIGKLTKSRLAAPLVGGSVAEACSKRGVKRANERQGSVAEGRLRGRRCLRPPPFFSAAGELTKDQLAGPPARWQQCGVKRDHVSANERQGSVAEDRAESIEKLTKDQLAGMAERLARRRLERLGRPSRAGSKDQLAGVADQSRVKRAAGQTVKSDWCDVDYTVRRKAAMSFFTQRETVKSDWSNVDYEVRRKAAMSFFTQRQTQQ